MDNVRRNSGPCVIRRWGKRAPRESLFGIRRRRTKWWAQIFGGKKSNLRDLWKVSIVYFYTRSLVNYTETLHRHTLEILLSVCVAASNYVLLVFEKYDICSCDDRWYLSGGGKNRVCLFVLSCRYVSERDHYWWRDDATFFHLKKKFKRSRSYESSVFLFIQKKVKRSRSYESSVRYRNGIDFHFVETRSRNSSQEFCRKIEKERVGVLVVRRRELVGVFRFSLSS